MQPDESILANLRKCISLREKYINTSLQNPSDNPRDISNTVSDPPNFEEELLSYYHKDYSHPLFNPQEPFSNSYSNFKNVGRAYHLSTYNLNACAIPPSNSDVFILDNDGIYKVYSHSTLVGSPTLFPAPSIKEFFQDLEYILAVIHDGPTKTLCYKRLKYLDASFGIYLLLNEPHEVQEQKVKLDLIFFGYSPFLIVISIMSVRWIHMYTILHV